MMATGWSRSDGWRSYEDWKRWYLQEWGRLRPPPPQSPSRKLDGAYRLFSTPDGVQSEVELAAVEPQAALSEATVREQAQQYLLRLNDQLLRDPDDGTTTVRLRAGRTGVGGPELVNRHGPDGRLGVIGATVAGFVIAGIVTGC